MTRRQALQLTILHKILNQNIDLDADLYIKRKTSRSRHVHNMQFEVHYHTSTPYIQSFFPEAVSCWNALSQSSVDKQTCTSFKTCTQDQRFHSPHQTTRPLSSTSSIVSGGLFGGEDYKVQGTRYKVQVTFCIGKFLKVFFLYKEVNCLTSEVNCEHVVGLVTFFKSQDTSNCL